MRFSLILCGFLALVASKLNAADFRVLEISFSDIEYKTLAVYESELGGLYIEALDIPDNLLKPDVLSMLPRFSDAFCNSCIAVSDLGFLREEGRTASATLTVFPQLLLPQALDLKKSANLLDFQSRPSLFLNYELLGTYDSESKEKRGAADLQLGLGMGSFGTLYHSEFYEEGGRRTRGETFLRHINVSGLSEIRLGDVVARSGALGSAARLIGIQGQRNFGIDPNVVATPVYAFNAVNAQPTVVDLYIDGQRQRRQEVQAGEFTLEGVQGNHGSEVTLVLEDTLGRKRVVRSTLLGTYNQLGKGKVDYSYSIGLLRQAENEYENLAGSADFGYGLRNNLTLKLHAETTREASAGSVGLIWSTRPLVFEFYGAQSSGKSNGYAFRYGLTSAPGRVWRRLKFGINGQTAKGYERVVGGESGEFQRAFLAARFGRFSTGITHERSVEASTKEVDVSTSVSLSARLGASWGVVIGARRFNNIQEDDLWFAGISWAPRNRNYRASAGAFGNRVNEGGNVELAAGLPFANSAFNLSYDQVRNVETGQRTETGELRLYSRFDDLALDYRLDDTAARDLHSLSLRGGLALAAWRPYFTPYLNDNAGYMQVETGLSGVQLRRGQYVTRSDFRGVGVVPTQGYRPQSVIVERGSLPPGYSIQPVSSGERVLPGARGKIAVPINPPGFLLHIKGLSAPTEIYWNGKALPYFDIGAYVENAIIGNNELVLAGKKWIIPIAEISIDVPDYYFDPARGKLSVTPWEE